MIRKVLIPVILLAMLGGPRAPECLAKSGSAGTRSAQFLKLGLGGRAAAMGGAFVGLADDASAVYWNPAGLAGADRTELGFMHLAWLQEIAYEYFALVWPVKKRGAVGFGISYLHMDKLQGRDRYGEPTSDFSAGGMAITLGFGREITGGLLLGGSIKSIDERIDDRNAFGLAFDFGCLYRTPVENLFLGGVIQNWGKDMAFVEESFGLPRIFRLGASYRRSLAGNPVNLGLDVSFPADDETCLHSGIEYIYENTIAARMGYNNGSDLGSRAGLSFGLGLAVTRSQIYRIDYAFVPQGVLGSSHTFSFSISF
jgi:hypothetical protein